MKVNEKIYWVSALVALIGTMVTIITLSIAPPIYSAVMGVITGSFWMLHMYPCYVEYWNWRNYNGQV